MEAEQCCRCKGSSRSIATNTTKVTQHRPRLAGRPGRPRLSLPRPQIDGGTVLSSLWVHRRRRIRCRPRYPDYGWRRHALLFSSSSQIDVDPMVSTFAQQLADVAPKSAAFAPMSKAPRHPPRHRPTSLNSTSCGSNLPPVPNSARDLLIHQPWPIRPWLVNLRPGLADIGQNVAQSDQLW